RELADSGTGEEIGHRRRKRAGRTRKRSDETVAREGAGTFVVGSASGKHRVLERYENAEVAARRIDRADEANCGDKPAALDSRKSDSGKCHQGCAKQEQIAEIVSRRDKADGERQQRGAEKRNSRDEANFDGIEADPREVSGQQDDCESIAKATQAARGIEQ